CVLRTTHRACGVGRTGDHPRGDVSRRQPAGGLPVPGEMMTQPTLLISAARIFDLSLGQMLWSRRSVFLGLLVGAPILLAALVRVIAVLAPSSTFRVNGA